MNAHRCTRSFSHVPLRAVEGPRYAGPGALLFGFAAIAISSRFAGEVGIGAVEDWLVGPE